MRSAHRIYLLFSSLFFVLSLAIILPRAVNAQTGRDTNYTGSKVCGDSCQKDSDCKAATIPGIQVGCRENKCVSLSCYDAGGNTIYGTRCDCANVVRGCGETCGADIGVPCAPGLSCTYRSQNQCGTLHAVCVPSGTQAANRGPMKDVPAYKGSTFQRRACGASTSDPQNNYIYHASFPNHVFTNAEINKYICNPAQPLTCVVKPNPTSVSLNPLATQQITATVTAKSGSTNMPIKSARVNFVSNNKIVSVSPISDTTNPYQTTIKAGGSGGSSNITVNAAIVGRDDRRVSCSAKVAVAVTKLSCSSKATCTPVGEGSGLQSGRYMACSMTAVNASGGSTVEYQGKCERKLGSTSKEKFNLTPVNTKSPNFQRFQLKTGNYHCEFRHCLKSSTGQTTCMDWEPGTIK